uniref:serine hydrolase n=2 Tax=Kitasatospora aureofaciens TaxID=1894 RepID=UPI0035A96C3A
MIRGIRPLLRGSPNSVVPFASARPDAVQQGMNALVRDDGLPAAPASVTDRDGRTRNHTAGVGGLATGSKVPVDGQVRIGSNTKTFTAVVVLQLVGEGKIGGWGSSAGHCRAAVSTGATAATSRDTRPGAGSPTTAAPPTSP